MALKLSDLPPGLQAQALAKAGGKPKGKRGRTLADGAPCPGRCSCGATFAKYTTWENKHWPGCRGRWSIDLEETP